MLTIADIAKSYGPRTLFSKVSFYLSRADRLGLVGPNGAGKSTLFRLILGEETPDEGSITWERGADFGFLPQESAPVGSESILDMTRGGAVADSAPDEPPDTDSVIHDYSREPRAKKILSGLGFRNGDFERPANSFSGGWVMRAHLARLLLDEPALLILDEPTNHLDLEALLWFQNHLMRYPGGLLVVSHDRAFLNALTTGILELRSGRCERYTGNYDSYLAQRDARHQQQRALFKNQQREIAHLQRFVDRFGAKASLASRAKSKEKQIARLLEAAVDEPEEDLRRIRFRFPQPPRSGLKVAVLENVFQAYGDHVVYAGDLNLTLERGQRTVLVGPNGAGKSTLLKILAGIVPIGGGTRQLGANVAVGYYSQNRIESLNPEVTVFENLMERRTAANDLTEQKARTILGAFLFRKDDVFKKVSVLSGGEKSRLALARLLADPPNLLLIDEPTTHLDIPSIDALIHALNQYEGTLVFISHDVYFIRAVARHVIHVNAGRVTPYAGDYDYYLDKARAGDAREGLVAGFTDARPRQSAAPATAQSGPQSRHGPKTKAQRRAEAEARAARSAPLRETRNKVRTLEEAVVELENRQRELVGDLEEPATYEDPGKPLALNRELADVVTRLEKATRDWENAANRLLELEA